MSLLENHAMLRDADRCFFFEGVFSWKTDFLGNCSHEGQIHSYGSSSVLAQHLKEESRGLILLGNV